MKTTCLLTNLLAAFVLLTSANIVRAEGVTSDTSFTLSSGSPSCDQAYK